MILKITLGRRKTLRQADILKAMSGSAARSDFERLQHGYLRTCRLRSSVNANHDL